MCNTQVLQTQVTKALMLIQAMLVHRDKAYRFWIPSHKLLVRVNIKFHKLPVRAILISQGSRLTKLTKV